MSNCQLVAQEILCIFAGKKVTEGEAEADPMDTTNGAGAATQEQN